MKALNTIPRFAAPYGTRDFLAAISSLFRKEPVSAGPFRTLLGDRPAIWTSSGRQALRMILEALRLPPGSGVAVPLYADTSVHDAIKAAGLRNVFVDVDPNTLTLDPAKLARVRGEVAAIVVVHFFGHVAAMHEILRVAQGLPVIEDTAHAPLSYLGGHMTGTLGAACFYSFASTKYWPAGGGGLAVVNDQTIAARLVAHAAAQPSPSLFDELLNPVKQIAKAFVFRRRLYGALGRPFRARAERMGVLEPRLADRRIFRGQAAVAVRQVKDFRLRVERHRANSLRLIDRLRGCQNITLPVETPGTRYNYHLFPVLLADPVERNLMAAALLRRHVDTSKIYFDLIERASANGYSGGCPVSESAASRMLTLPNHAGLSEGDIDRVASAFEESLREVRASRQSNFSLLSTAEKEVAV